jgi:serine beta-lactamase-like protein LACTB
MLRRLFSLIMVLTILVPGLFIQAQEPAVTVAPSLAAQADARLSRWFDANQPGAAVLLIQDGKVLFKKGYGLANVELGVPMQPDNVFRIGSVTKQFTAAAVMLLVEESKVDLQAPISRYLEKLPKTWVSVTVEQLLNHTSGIPNYTDSKDYWKHMREDLTPIQLLELSVNKLPLDFESGTQMRYTNTGYILLGMMIEKVSGQPYARFLQKRIFEPLNLKHTRYDSVTDLIPGMVSGYTLGPKPAYFWSVTQKYAAGGLVSNAEDLARWTLALHSGQVVKPESLARMLTPTRLRNGKEEPYGYGLGFRQSQGNRLVGHGGSVSGFECYVEADPTVKAAAVILHNTDYYKVDNKYLARFLLSQAAGKPIPELKPAAIEHSKLRRLTGWYTREGEFRFITFNGTTLFTQVLGGLKYTLIPISETEFALDGWDKQLRFELAGDQVLGVHRLYAEDPQEEPLQKRMDPIEDKDPKITNMVKQGLRDTVEGTLKSDLFTPDCAAELFPDRVTQAAAFLKSLGQQTGIALYAREERSGRYRYLYRVSYGEKNLIVRLWVEKNDLISDIWFDLE